MTRHQALKRLTWRIGRKIYMSARQEERFGAINRNGEAYAIRNMISHTNGMDQLVVFDIGANQGDWTKQLLLSMPAERKEQDRLSVHAFEPVPETSAMYRDAIDAMVGSNTVTLHETAMSDKPGVAEIGLYSAGAGTNSIHFDKDDCQIETTLKIDLSTIDGFVAKHGLERVHYAKCDTEGHDARVILGARQSLEQGVIDVLQFEYNHRWVFARSFLKDIFDLIDVLPYSLAKITENGALLYETWHPELDRFFQSNYILVHDRAITWFDVHHGRFDQANTYA
ncbi:MAG: FkbM family methyltransferase [Pseudomonadota bacterium]